MNRRLIWALIAAAVGSVPVASSAEKQGQIERRSEASISINMSVAPRVHVRSSEVMTATSARLRVMCLISNLPPASFTMMALPSPRSGSSPSAGDPRQSAIPQSSAGCGSSQNINKGLAILAQWAPEAATEDRRGQGPLVVLVRPE